jgi:glycosyltransferase involved in cell wall biosynthesis
MSAAPDAPAVPPRVSVVVPTYRRPALLTRCLGAILAQRLDPAAFEIVVVDDGHDDATRDAVEALARRSVRPTIRYLRPARGRGPAVARNAGWRAAHAPLIAFTDDDTIPDPDWLAEGERAIGRAAAVAGRVLVPRGDDASTRPTDHELMTRGLERAEFVTANAFVRRDALATVGGFDERFARAWREDSDLQFRLLEDVGTIVRCPTAVVAHPVRPERWGVSLRQQKNVFYDALLYKKHPRLYRERILGRPPWDYYGIVGLAGVAAVAAVAGRTSLAWASGGIASALVLAFALRRLSRTSRRPAHVAEMLVTSAAIPFLSVYWRLRGAVHYRVAYL